MKNSNVFTILILVLIIGLAALGIGLFLIKDKELSDWITRLGGVIALIGMAGAVFVRMKK